jgi:Protein of unknown function (DUF4013)
MSKGDCVICQRCGNAGSGKFCGHCGAEISLLGAGGPVTWPFFQASWPLSLWMPLTWAVPFSGNFLARGWSVDAIRRRALNRAELLPQPEEITSLFGKGFILFWFWVLYIFLPLLVMGWLMSWSWLLPIWEFVVVLWGILWHKPHENLAEFLVRNVIVFLADAAAPILYTAIATPMFFVGRLRYALTGEGSSFLQLIANGAFCFRYAGEILLYFFLSTALRILFVSVAVLFLTVPALGQLLPFLLGGAGIWIRSYWAARVAAKMLITSHSVAQMRA